VAEAMGEEVRETVAEAMGEEVNGTFRPST
jgi:hypothetical protein